MKGRTTLVRWAIVVGLVAGPSSVFASGNPTSTNPTNPRVIQVERAIQGQWVAEDPIRLDQNRTLYGDNVNEPTTALTLDADAVDRHLVVVPRLTVSCGGRTFFQATFNATVVNLPWSVSIDSPCGVWRYTLVEPSQVKRPVPGVGFIPAAPAAR